MQNSSQNPDIKVDIFQKNEFQKEILKTVELESVLKVLDKEIGNIHAFDSYYFGFLDEKNEALVIESMHFSPEFEHFEKYGIKTKYSITFPDVNSFCTKKNEVIYLDKSNVKNFHTVTQRVFHLFKVVQAAFVPIAKGNDVIGILGLINHNHEIDKEKVGIVVRLIEDYFDVLRASFSNNTETKHLQKVEADSLFSEKIIQIIERINNLTSVEKMYESIFKELTNFFPFDISFILLEKDNRLHFEAGLSNNKIFDNILLNLKKHVNQDSEYILDPPNSASAELMLRKTYFYFPDVMPLMKLPKMPVDEKALEIIGNARTALIVPILHKKNPVGVIHLYTLEKTYPISEPIIEIIKTLGEIIYTIISNSQFYSLVKKQKARLSAAKRKIEKTKNTLKEWERVIKEDLEIANHVISDLISRNYHDICELNFHVYFAPKIEVGGDIYDIVRVSDNLCRIFIADIPGHGIQASLKTILVKIEYDKIKNLYPFQPNQLLIELNRILCTQYFHLFLYIPCIIMDIHLDKMEITYSSAGHPNQYHVFDDTVNILEGGETVIGLKNDTEYQNSSFQLQPESKIILFTDGLYEQFTQEREMFGEQGICQIIKDNKDASIQVLSERMISELKEWTKNHLQDDITLIIFERNSK